MSFGKRVARWLAMLLAALALAVLALLYFATVELSPGGVHQRLRLPVPGLGDIAIPNYAGTADAVSFDNYLEGPLVRRVDTGGWAARWLCNGQPGEASGTTDRLEIACAGRTHSHLLADLPEPAADLPMPTRVAVISDLEGQADFFAAAVRRMGVVDGAGNWAFGQGALIILGDSVDRGRDVTKLLWTIRNLAVEAGQAGGAVHYVLGNHEQYILRGNISRANAEHLYGLRQLGGVNTMFAGDSVLGQWLRSQPVALKLGDTLFVHGGISPEVVRSGVTLAELNVASRAYFARPVPAAAPSPALDAAFGLKGVTQYRGLIMPLEGLYPLVTPTEVDAALNHFGVTRIVVAHSIVPQIEPSFDGKVWPIDVADPASAPEVLEFVQGEPRVMNIGLARNPEKPAQIRWRRFDMFSAQDWAMLGEMIAGFRTLSRLPHPY
ncbi:MAG: metallophosphoesterase [Novosphingobium sp.]|jgi:hypothetical protein|nr:metallophosphoesterase [Novosphingobium sp.]